MWLVVLLLLSIIFIILSTARWGLHPFLALLMAAFGYGVLSGKMPLEDVAKSVNFGFGDTVGRIGIVAEQPIRGLPHDRTVFADNGRPLDH